MDMNVQASSCSGTGSAHERRGCTLGSGPPSAHVNSLSDLQQDLERTCGSPPHSCMILHGLEWSVGRGFKQKFIRNHAALCAMADVNAVSFQRRSLHLPGGHNVTYPVQHATLFGALCDRTSAPRACRRIFCASEPFPARSQHSCCALPTFAGEDSCLTRCLLGIISGGNIYSSQH